MPACAGMTEIKGTLSFLPDEGFPPFLSATWLAGDDDLSYFWCKVVDTCLLGFNLKPLDWFIPGKWGLTLIICCIYTGKLLCALVLGNGADNRPAESNFRAFRHFITDRQSQLYRLLKPAR